MLTLLKKSSENFHYSSRSDHQKNTTRYDQSMSYQHSCPYCSYILLRHINEQGLYWYCSHCHQEMPAYNA